MLLPIHFQVGIGFYDLSKSDLRLTQINPGKKYQYVPRDMHRMTFYRDIYHVIAKNEHFPFLTDSFLCFFE